MNLQLEQAETSMENTQRNLIFWVIDAKE